MNFTVFDRTEFLVFFSSLNKSDGFTVFVSDCLRVATSAYFGLKCFWLINSSYLSGESVFLRPIVNKLWRYFLSEIESLLGKVLLNKPLDKEFYSGSGEVLVNIFLYLLASVLFSIELEED